MKEAPSWVVGASVYAESGVTSGRDVASGTDDSLNFLKLIVSIPASLKPCIAILVLLLL